MKVILLAALVAFASAFEFDAKLDDMWTMWKAKFGRVYESENEVMRRAIWEKTVAFVNKHNLEADLGLHTYTLGLNQLSDLTNEEYKQLLGYRQGVHTGPVTEYMAPLNMGPMADDVDWRTKGYVNTIKNQGACGSCWAFSATAALEGQMFKKTGVLQNYAEQQLVDCSRYTGNMGCNGGWMDWAFQYVKDITAKGQFQDITSCYPYKAVDQSCQANFAATCKGATCTGFTDIKKNNETDLASAIMTAGPVSVAIDASRPTFSSYRSGVYNDPSCSSTNLDHGVTAVGYGNSGSDYYIVRNSWGTTWGNQGYILMSRNKNNQCGIAAAASYPSV